MLKINVAESSFPPENDRCQIGGLATRPQTVELLTAI